MSSYSYKDGRIWFQRQKFTAFQLLLPYGMTNVTDPAGALTAVREPDATKRRKSNVVDILKGEPGLSEFQIETRFFKTLNYMISPEFKDCPVNFQCHMGACGRPDDYYASEVGLHEEKAHRGDLTIDRVAILEGDDAMDAVAVPWAAEIGPLFLDFVLEFRAAMTIAETEAITGLAFLESECFADCKAQENAGENGYASTEFLSGSPVNVANVWYTEDEGDTWAEVSARPFAAGETVSDVVVNGRKANHRVIVSRGTTDAGNPAEIAYADVTDMGTVTWVNVDVGAVDGQYINKLAWPDYAHLFAVTDDGYIYLSTDGGATWTAVLTTAVNAFNDIMALTYGDNAGHCWAVGDSNMVYFSNDFGQTWSAETGPADGAGDNNLTVYLSPDGTIFVGNDAGEVYGSYDQATEWTTLAAQGVTATAINMIRGWGDAIIWMVVDTASGGECLRSTDGGASFRLWSLNTPANSGLNVVCPVGLNETYIAGDPHGGSAFVTKTRSQLTGF